MKECGVSMLCVSSTWKMIIGGEEDTFMLVLVMKEYGIKESWNQLFKIKFTPIDRFVDDDMYYFMATLKD